ncbi:MAG: galactokinase [Erythrobacter sp.]|uniref:galactokinase n=1 Tax=Erythrobacter sp. TaxID=1042 RepID=UPI00260B8081|nr:galactokinase [Erythrobacter sp.]MDJ0979209.1 galactokinase [Erythrobacter sp.]
MIRRERLIARARQGYRLAFGTQGESPRRFFAAPGRVNLIGEHVDYNEGFVLPCAINRETVVAIQAGPEVGGQGYIEAVAIDFGQNRDKIALYEPIARSDSSWQNLLRGVVVALQKRGHEVLPARLAITGDVPIGAGLSSSASFAVVVALALAYLSRIQVSKAELALVAQEAENDFLGTKCGIMDQMASALGASDAALLLDCRSGQSMPIAVSSELALVVADTGIRRELVTSAFNERRAQCEAAAKHFNVRALRDLSARALEAGRRDLDATLYKRARHVVSEIARVEPTAVALNQGDTAAIARLFAESHTSLREDYEVTVPEVDRLVGTIGAALSAGDTPLGGVRMTGAGFGGCVVAVVRKSAADLVLEAVHDTYNADADTPASAAIYSMVGGASDISPQRPSSLPTS